jgi:hypothetical protein
VYRPENLQAVDQHHRQITEKTSHSIGFSGGEVQAPADTLLK